MKEKHHLKQKIHLEEGEEADDRPSLANQESNKAVPDPVALDKKALSRLLRFSMNEKSVAGESPQVVGLQRDGLEQEILAAKQKDKSKKKKKKSKDKKRSKKKKNDSTQNTTEGGLANAMDHIDETSSNVEASDRRDEDEDDTVVDIIKAKRREKSAKRESRRREESSEDKKNKDAFRNVPETTERITQNGSSSKAGTTGRIYDDRDMIQPKKRDDSEKKRSKKDKKRSKKEKIVFPGTRPTINRVTAEEIFADDSSSIENTTDHFDNDYDDFVENPDFDRNDTEEFDEEGRPKQRPGAVAVEGPRFRSASTSSGGVRLQSDDDGGDDDDDNDDDEEEEDDTSHILLEATLVSEDADVSQRRLAQIENETRQRLIKEAVEAKIVEPDGNDDDDDDHDGKKFAKKIIFGGLLLLIVVLGVTIGAAVGTRSNGQPSVVAPRTPTLSPQLITQTLAPTIQPSEQPSERPLDNQYCDEAHLLKVGGPAVTAVIDTNTTVQTIEFCRGEESSFLDFHRGLWYRYEGDGKQLQLKAEGSVIMNVYALRTPDNCDFNSGGHLECPREVVFGNSITWKALGGITYLILVSEELYYGQQMDIIEFQLSLFDNDSCEHALGPITSSTTLVGSNFPDLPLDDSDIPSCGLASGLEMPGAWYFLFGNGEQISASTCGGTSFDTQISVFAGTCGALQCVDGNDDACGGTSQSLVAWQSEMNQLYFILVHSARGSSGDFALEITLQGTEIPLEAFCGTAPRLVLGTDRAFNLQQANVPEAGVEICQPPIPLGDYKGLWFRVAGTGNTLLVETTNSAGELLNTPCGTSITILQGSRCADLSCVAADCLDVCEWPSEAGQDYFIFVHDYMAGYDPDGVIRVSEVANRRVKSWRSRAFYDHFA